MKDYQDRIGQQVGEYCLLRLLGKDTFGVVYLAEHVHDQTPAAIKLLQIQLNRSADLKNFLNEARTMRLRHPHIVPLLDFGLSRDDLPFLVMEYAAGGTLRDRHPHGTQLPLFTVSRYVSELASALQYAHENRVIHRDIKPENMLLHTDGRVLLSDFGIAHMVEHSTTMSMQTQAGSPAYMAPEQTQGKPGPASDQYALAVAAYEWLAGRRPFLGVSLEVALQHRLDAPPSLCTIRPDVPQDAERVLFQALAKQPAERFATVAQFAQALSAALQQDTAMRKISASSDNMATSTVPLVAPHQEQTLAIHEETDTLPTLVKPQPTNPSMPQAGDKKALLTPFVPTPPAPVTAIPTPPRTHSHALSSWHVLVLVVLVLLVGSGALFGHSLLTSLPLLSPVHTSTAVTITAHTTASAQNQPQQATDPYNKWVAANGIMFGFNPQHTGNNPYEHILSTGTVAGLQLRWKFSSGSAIYSSSPVVANGMVYIGSSDHKLYAVDAVTSQMKWAFRAGDVIGTSPALVNGVIYIGSNDGKLYAVNVITGQQKWAFLTGGAIGSSPTVANGVVYAGSVDGKLYAVDALTGQMKWAFPTGDHIYTSSPAVANGVIYIGSGNGKLYAIDAATGQQKWAFSTGSDITASPAVDNGIVYIGSSDHYVQALYAIDAASGQQKWRFPVKYYIDSSPAVDNGVVYFSSEDHKLYAIDATTGQQKWAFLTGGAVDSSPEVANGVIYIGSSDSRVYAIDAATGQQKWAFLTGSYIDSSPTVVNGVVYIGSSDHNLYTFALSGQP